MVKTHFYRPATVQKNYLRCRHVIVQIKHLPIRVCCSQYFLYYLKGDKGETGRGEPGLDGIPGESVKGEPGDMGVPGPKGEPVSRTYILG